MNSGPLGSAVGVRLLCQVCAFHCGIDRLTHNVQHQSEQDQYTSDTQGLRKNKRHCGAWCLEVTSASMWGLIQHTPRDLARIYNVCVLFSSSLPVE